MAATGGSSVRKRPHQACQNCRRKKTRCPGEKPACSTCVRLSQGCNYATSTEVTRGRQPVEDRLSFLEEQLDSILNGPGDHVTDGQKKTSDVSEIIPESSSCSDDIHISPSEEIQEISSRPPPSTVARALDVYFQRFHRQPVWCFNQEDVKSHEMIADELLSAIMALSCHFLPHAEWLQHYTSTTRSLIMLHIANGTVRVATLESLCLLSLSLLHEGAVDLAQFHLRLGIELCQSARTSTGNTYQHFDHYSERKKRVFWSLQLLEQYHGRNTELLYAPSDTQSFSSSHDLDYLYLEQHTTSKVPPLPCEDSLSTDSGVWGYTTQLGYVWSKLRTYVSDCYQYNIQKPWLPNSMYNILQSELLESENMLPMYHRWDLAKFWARDPNDVKLNLAYWIPWLKLQFTYHAVHTLLNHPFLYIAASQHNQNFAIPNTFWKRSSHLVLLHATWIVRLIDMISEKKVALTDPCFAHIAAIAATVHLHFSYAADPRLRIKSNSELAKCSTFLKEFGSFSGCSRALNERLEHVIQVASLSTEAYVDGRCPPTIRLSTYRMWEILQFKCESKPQKEKAYQLFDQSLKPALDQQNTETSILEVYVATPIEISINTSDGGQAAPAGSIKAGHRDYGNNDTISPRPDDLIPETDWLRPDTSWMWTNVSNGNNDTPGESGAPLAMFDLNASTWWNFGNL